MVNFQKFDTFKEPIGNQKNIKNKQVSLLSMSNDQKLAMQNLMSRTDVIDQ